MKRLILVWKISVLLLLMGFTLCAFAQKITDGLVGYWPLDENGNDKIGKSTGKLEGKANWVKNGRVKGAVELDGATGHVAISGFTLTTNDITAVAWLNGSPQGAWAGIMCSRADPMTFWVGYTDSNTLSTQRLKFATG
ncbi:LamG domain-containing protein [Candidatus Poribacteria bacterium]|nr:LamG domain-containing protein [Candidatus Poribacteria bacterium]